MTDIELKEFLTNEGYSLLTEVPDKGLCGIYPFMFTWGLVCGLDKHGYNGRYCYDSSREAMIALKNWDGTGDPSGPWIKYKGEGEIVVIHNA